MNKLFRTCCLLALLCSATAWSGPHFDQQLIPRTGAFSVSSDQEWLIVGVPVECTFYVYLMDFTTMLWGDGAGNAGQPFQEQLAPGPGACPSAETRGFAEVVSVKGNLLIVGAPEAKGPKTIERDGVEAAALSGSVFGYAFNGTQWELLGDGVLEAEAPDGTLRNSNGMRFGAAVSIDQDLVAIGAPTNGQLNDANSGRGEVYVYRYDPVAELFENLGFVVGETDLDQLGFSVTVSNQRFLAGVPGSDLSGVTDAGAAYLFTVEPDDTIALDDRILATPDFIPVSGDALGIELSLSDDIALLAGLVSYPAEPDASSYTPKFEYTRSNGGDVSQSVGVSAFGVNEIGVDIYPDILNDNADQRSNYHLEIDLTGSGSTTGNGVAPLATDGPPIPLLATDIRLYKDNAIVNDLTNNQVRSLVFPCGYGTGLEAFEWSLVSIPCDLPPGTTVEEAFNADIFPGACDPECGALGVYGTNWEVWGQDGTDYVSNRASQRFDADDVIQTGRGYWLISDASLKPAGQPVYWNVADTTSTSYTPLDGGNGGFGTVPDDVAGYHEVILPPGVPTNQIAKVMIGNPFPRSFDWENVGVSVTVFDIRVPLTAVSTIDPLYRLTAYLYNPDSLEGQPYDTVSNTPGFNGTSIPPNTGVWILIDSGLFQVSTNAIYLPLEQ